ncbi:MAG: rhodanese-like domain-containing protein [Gemmatimonadota bacterium]
MRKVTTDELADMLQKSETWVFNVLAPKEFERGHIPGTENIPIGGSDFLAQARAVVPDEDTPVVVYCAGPECKASARAANALAEAGYMEVYAYEGGMKEWIAAGNEVETGERTVARRSHREGAP